MENEITVLVFDPTMDWIDRSNISEYLTVKTTNIFNIDIPDNSTIYDLSKLTIIQQQQFVENFCGSLYLKQSEKSKRERPWYFLIFEEAHTYFPQGSLRAKAFQETVRILTQGRNFNIRVGCITQFASLLDKNALRYMKQRYLGWTDELNDVNYIKGFIGDKAEELKTLKAGEFIYSHPANNILKKIQIKPHEQTVKPQRIILPSPILIQQTNTNPQAHTTLGSAIIWMMFLMFMLWLILRR